MKILIDAHVFDGKFQGTRTYIKGLYNKLIDRNPQWDFYFIANKKENLINEFQHCKNVYFLEYHQKNRIVQLLFEIPWRINKLNIDYSHFQYISPLIKIGKYIVTSHDILFEEKRFQKYFPLNYRRIKGPLFKISAKRADKLLTVSEYSRNKISELYNIPKQSIVLTPNAVEVITDYSNEITKQNLEKILIQKYILYVSRIEPRKNHISVLKAYDNLNLVKQGYNIVFVGNYDIVSKELDDFISIKRDLFKSNLHIFEKVSNNELCALYKKASLVLYPSISEGFGIPPLEAALLNKKVVCSKLTAMSEFNFFPYHIDPTNQDELENSIVNVLQDQDYPFELIKNEILKKYSWEKSARSFENMLHLKKNNE
ncbi:MAG: glycosyltransferase family 4 protein [Flavobacteriaceae bacterium]|nr:glycosyltransferase family 4 protein [Flavobacteriaceae bacterium]